MQFRAFKSYCTAPGITYAVTAEAQSSDYESGLALIDNEAWHVRTARTTSLKPGAFVAFWKRDSSGTTSPFSTDDPAKGLLVFVEQSGRRGVFRFTKAILDELGITSGRQPGKRGFRVYPPWCENLNNQAAMTQRAQVPTFKELSDRVPF